MSKLIINHLFFFFLLNLVINQEQNNNNIIEEPNQTKLNLNQTINQTHSQNQQKQNKYNDKNHPYNLTMNEMDTMMFCSIIVQETLRTKVSEVENITKKLNLSSTNPVYEKIGTDIFEQCNKKANILLVNTFIKNLTYFNNFKWDKNFESLAQINYGKYNNKSDLILTQNQRVLMYLYQRVDVLFQQKRADETVEQRNKPKPEINKKIKIGNIDVDNIPKTITFGAFLLVIILLFGGVMYFLKKMEKKSKDKKKDKKKKTQ